MIGVVLLAVPSIFLFIPPPATQRFSEIYALGPSHTFDDVPFNIQANTTYSLYLGVVNQMGSAEYYTCSVKFGNGASSLPSSTLDTPSSLPTLYEYKSLVADGDSWETPLTFQVNSMTFINKECQIYSITINGMQYSVNIPSTWDSSNSGYYYNLLVELSIYNSTIGSIQYNNRYVLLALNMTS